MRISALLLEWCDRVMEAGISVKSHSRVDDQQRQIRMKRAISTGHPKKP